ncbi:helix-turn-helix domain-containing protein [Nocardioides humilatus]|nr:helix-turn-helix transcriptional regulator [Nocardioides humilatus]
MDSRRSVLREVMSETGTTQSELSRISGVKQPSLSQFLSGRVEMSDDMLDRLLSCMGYRLEVVRRPIRRDLGRSPERSWRLHRELSKHLTHSTLKIWEPTIRRNLGRLLSSVQGEPHIGNLGRWRRLVDERDITQLRRMMTGRDTDSIQMREVSPLGGLLSQDERSRALERVG